MHTNQHTNPLFQLGADSQCRASQSSPTRDHPKPQESPVDGKPSRKQARRRLCQCCRTVPWIAALCAAVSIGALVVWSVHTERLITALLTALRRIRAPSTLLAQIPAVVGTVQIAVIAAVSAVMGLLLLAAVVRELQVRKKQRALTYSDWPQGWRMYSYLVPTVILLIALWFICAALLCLLCMSVAAAGLALVGEIGAGTLAGVTAGVNTATNSAVTEVASAVAKAGGAVATQMANAPAEVQRQPWFKSLNSSVSPLLQGAAGAAVGNISCPSTCLDLDFIIVALPCTNASTMETCVCSQQKLIELQQQFSIMWRAGMAACTALAALLVVGSWMLMRGVADCVSARRDHLDAAFFQREHQQAHQRENRVRNWVQDSPTASFDIKADQRRQEQLIAPELGVSMSPKKAKVQDWSSAVGDICMSADIEQPAPRDDQVISPTSASGTLSSQPSYIRPTTASMARHADTQRSLQSTRPLNDTMRSTVSVNGNNQRTKRRWQ